MRKAKLEAIYECDDVSSTLVIEDVSPMFHVDIDFTLDRYFCSGSEFDRYYYGSEKMSHRIAYEKGKLSILCDVGRNITASISVTDNDENWNAVIKGATTTGDFSGVDVSDNIDLEEIRDNPEYLEGVIVNGKS